MPGGQRLSLVRQQAWPHDNAATLPPQRAPRGTSEEDYHSRLRSGPTSPAAPAIWLARHCGNRSLSSPQLLEGGEILFYVNDGLSQTRRLPFPSLPGPPHLLSRGSLKIPAAPAREAGTLARTAVPAPRSASPLPSPPALPLPSPPGRVGLGPPAPGKAQSPAGAVGAEAAESRGRGSRAASAFRSLSTRRPGVRPEAAGGPRGGGVRSRLWRPCLPGDAVTDRAGGACASPRLAPPRTRGRGGRAPRRQVGRGGEGGRGLPRRRAGLRGLGPCGRPAAPASRRPRVPGRGLAFTRPMSGRTRLAGRAGPGVPLAVAARRGAGYITEARRHMAAERPPVGVAHGLPCGREHGGPPRGPSPGGVSGGYRGACYAGFSLWLR